MNRVLRLTTAFAAGAATMYCLDAAIQRRRRAFMRGKPAHFLRNATDFAWRKAGHIIDHSGGDATAGDLERIASMQPQSDARLREQILSRLGHWVSHPGAIEVEVNEGIVRLSGQVLSQEFDGLVSQLKEMAGVRKIHNALGVLSDPSGFSAKPSRSAIP